MLNLSFHFSYHLALAEDKKSIFEILIRCQTSSDGCKEFKNDSQTTFYLDQNSMVPVIVKNARVVADNIEFTVDINTQRLIEHLTEKNIGKQLAFVVNGKIISLSVISKRISSESLVLPISGNSHSKRFEICKSIYSYCPNSIELGGCYENHVRIQFINNEQKDFPLKGEKCSNFKLSNNRFYAGWVTTKKEIAESSSVKEDFEQSALNVYHNGKILNISEWISLMDWQFVEDKDLILSQWMATHGPSAYFLYDIKTEKNISQCNQVDLKKCPVIDNYLKAK
jgi:hypothetical protein